MVIAVTVCFVVIFSLIAIVVAEIMNPDIDTVGSAAVVSDIVNTLIGVMAGFLAGRTESTTPKVEPPE